MSDKDDAIAHHHWIIEFNTQPTDLSQFAVDLDNYLKRINSDYDAKRKGDLNLTMLKIQNVPSSTFIGWMKHRGKLGGQNKVPRLHPNNDYIKDLHDFLENRD